MKGKNTRGIFIYSLAISLFISMKILDESMFTLMPVFATVIKVFEVVPLVLLIFKILIEDHHEAKQLIIYCAVIAYGLMIYLISKDKTFIYLSLFWVGIQDVPFQKIIKCSLIAVSIALATILLCCYTGLILDRMFDVSVRGRHGLGFTFPTTSANHFLYLTAAYAAYRGRKLRFSEILLLFAGNVYFFVMTDTKNCFAVAMGGIVLLVFLKAWDERHGSRFVSFAVKYAGMIGAAVAIVMTRLYDKVSFIKEVADEIVSGRFRYGSAAWNKYGIKPLGQQIKFEGGDLSFLVEAPEYNYVDSSYMQILLLFGIVTFLLLLVGYHLLGRVFVKRGCWHLGVALVMALLHAVFDPQLIWMHYNVFVIALGYLFITDTKKREELLTGYYE